MVWIGIGRYSEFRKQKGRARGFIGQTFLAIATRIDVATGNCEMCCAYEKANRLQISSWRSFSDALTFISQISPDQRTEKEIKAQGPDLKIPCTSSPSILIRLANNGETGCITYLSVRNDGINRNTRGQSCYQSSQMPAPMKDDSGSKVKTLSGIQLSKIGTNSPTTEQWPTPNPLEIVVSLRQPEDNPDQLATLVESLRYGFGHYGDATALPAPLFFERVVRVYISEFVLEESDLEIEE